MKKTFLLILASFSFFAKSQVGIKTDSPQATLDVAGEPTVITKADGIMAPRLTGDQLKAKDNVYDNLQTGALVYVTTPVTFSTTKTVNVTSAGYYYFDGNVWLKNQGATGTVVSYETLLSGSTVAYPGNNTLAYLDMSIGTGALASWRTNNTTLTVPPGKGGKYLVSFSGGVRVTGGTTANYSFSIYFSVNGITVSTPTTSIPQVNGNFNGATFTTSWNEVVNLSPGDTLRFQGLTFGTSGTPQSFRLSRVSIEQLEAF